MWSDFYKLFVYAFEDDPLSKKQHSRDLTGAGVTSPDAIPDIRQDGSFWGGGRGLFRLRDSNDFIDLSSISNRQSRYKEYERLRNVPEIEQAMTVIADEACLGGLTKISTVFYGLQTIKWLAENKKDEEFLVYCWDFKKEDYTIGWAYDPRIVKTAKTIRIILDNGTEFTATTDHRVLLRNGQWITAGELKFADELMPFYRIPANRELNKLDKNQFPRMFTFLDGWKHERQFVDEWRLGKKNEKYKRANEACRMLTSGLTTRETAKLMGSDWKLVETWIHKEGFTLREMHNLGRNPDRRRVVGIQDWKEVDVYDLSVKDYKNFCGESVIFHNCQKGENGHVCEIKVKSDEVKEELDFLFYNRGMLNVDRKLWSWFKKLCIMGDWFGEVIIDPENPKKGIYKIQELPADSLYRIETTKGKLVEFQQSHEGPDYESLTRAPVTQATDADIMQSKALRFSPNQIIHTRIGDDRKTFHPYGQSLVEPARGPAHQLRLMEDSMLVYRLSRAPERRIFYIDTGNLPPFKAEALVDRIKDMFRKKKVVTNRQDGGASSVDERWHAPAVDEDYWVPIRPNSNTRIDTLPGASNLSEVDDALYFRNKLFVALNFPKNYFSNEDINSTRITLSAQDSRFARMIERLQAYMEDALWEIADRHLRLMGVPSEEYDNLIIKLTPPSDWRELSKAEIVSNRINNATSLKSSMIYSDYDILTKILKHSDDDAKIVLSRGKLQKLEDLKLQVLGQNPALLGIGSPGQAETEMGAEASGPNPMLAPQQPQLPTGAPPEGTPQEQTPEGMQPQEPQKDTGSKEAPVPEPTEEDIKKYDFEIQNYSSEQDREDIDYSEA